MVHLGKLPQLQVSQSASVEQNIAQPLGRHIYEMVGLADEHRTYVGEVATQTPEYKGENARRQVKPELHVPPRPHDWTAL